MEPTLEEVAGVQTGDVLPSIDRLEKQVADIKGDITQLFGKECGEGFSKPKKENGIELPD